VDPSGDSPPDEAVLVRGGRCKVDSLVDAVERCFRDHKEHALSFSSLGDDGVPKPPRPNPEMRLITAERLRALGCTLRFTGRPGHVSAYLPENFNEMFFVMLEAALDPPIKNPRPAKGKGT
jgi:hypothetical protein